ncbi:MAG TPA: sodium:alanine symporter family protein, partial [Lachnoclostridium sp.]|nr:sodium:alanine symporter family protein [Lachnoclostridium sp.]
MIHRIHEMVWGPWLLVLFLGTGVFFTVKSGFFQIRKFPFWWKHTIGSIQEDEGEEKGEVTKFQTACTALAAT